jgi:hypothetical protein
VDEQRLATLKDDDFMSLRQSGYLPAIYAHLISLLQVDKFGALRASESNQNVVTHPAN